MTNKPPRAWINPWPHGQPAPHTPKAAIWVADLADQLTHTRNTPQQIAAATGLDPRTIAAVINGQQWPTLHTATQLVAYLHNTGHTPTRSE